MRAPGGTARRKQASKRRGCGPETMTLVSDEHVRRRVGGRARAVVDDGGQKPGEHTLRSYLPSHAVHLFTPSRIGYEDPNGCVKGEKGAFPDFTATGYLPASPARRPL